MYPRKTPATDNKREAIWPHDNTRFHASLVAYRKLPEFN